MPRQYLQKFFKIIFCFMIIQQNIILKQLHVRMKKKSPKELDIFEIEFDRIREFLFNMVLIHYVATQYCIHGPYAPSNLHTC
jgi:hypothetical protein